MKATEFVAGALTGGKAWMVGLVADLEDGDLVAAPTIKGGNHPLWVIGHLTASEASIVKGMIKGEQPNVPAGWGPLFGMGSQPVSDASKYPSKAELLEEISSVKKYGACGIGLFRSEYLYIARDDLPTEDEQYESYRQAVEQDRHQDEHERAGEHERDVVHERQLHLRVQHGLRGLQLGPQRRLREQPAVRRRELQGVRERLHDGVEFGVEPRDGVLRGSRVRDGLVRQRLGRLQQRQL